MSRDLHPTQRWTVGEWLFTEIDGRQISDSYKGRKMYGFSPAGEPPGAASRIHEWFDTLEHAMAAAIAEKYTGRRGAGGTGVGTAADWFMRMIGAHTLVPVDHSEGQKVLQDVIADTRQHDGPIYRQASAMGDQLEKRGLVIAKMNHG